MTNNPTLRSRIVDDEFNVVSSTNKLSYCCRCGFVGKQLYNVSRHVKCKSNHCSESDLRQAGGIIHTNDYGFLVPSDVLVKISQGSFVLPIKNQLNNACSDLSLGKGHTTDNTTTVTAQTVDDSLASHDAPLTVPTTTTELPALQVRPQFLPSDDEIMDNLTSDNPFLPFNDATSFSAFVRLELLDSFGDEEHVNIALEYLTSFIHLLNHQSPGLLKRTLKDYTAMMKTPADNTNLKLLILSGKKWLQTEAANMDVRMVPVHHRSGIYLIGNTFTDADKDLLSGSTFVWSENVDGIVSQYESLVKFAHGMQWPPLKPFLSQIGDVYTHTIDLNPTKDTEEIFDLTAAKIVNTNIIFRRQHFLMRPT